MSWLATSLGRGEGRETSAAMERPMSAREAAEKRPSPLSKIVAVESGMEKPRKVLERPLESKGGLATASRN